MNKTYSENYIRIIETFNQFNESCQDICLEENRTADRVQTCLYEAQLLKASLNHFTRLLEKESL